MRERCWALVALVLVAGCTGQARETRPATGAEAGAVAAGSAPAAARAIEFAELPATFEGTLPCADCPGIDYHLDLFPDGVFFLRQRYREREGSFDDIGLWAPASDGSLLSLHGGREAPLRLARTSRDELRLLGADGEPVSSEPDHALRARPVFAPIEPRLLLSGHYRYLADAPLFTECRTGLPMPVALEADNRALEGAYRQARPSPGAPVLVLLEGRIARRMPMEGPGPVATLVPERFLRVRAEQRCAPRFAPAALADTRWVLRQLGDRAVVPRGDGRAPHLVLRGEGGP